jgi:hypothetical protein
MSKITVGTRVKAPNHGKGAIEEGVVTSDLSTQYFINFDSGSQNFVFKNEQIKVISDMLPEELTKYLQFND